ncbi:MAG: hypothetical protein LBK42_06285 [Propionibacteriaceae bacterium]|jgi:DNA gyrase subunit A|nr:hypothetical protein [Propionibacteriaceae bacterium]
MEHVLLSATGRLARVDLGQPYAAARAAQAARPRSAHDVIVSASPVIGGVGAVTTLGRALRLPLDALPVLSGDWSLAGAPDAAAVLGLAGGAPVETAGPAAAYPAVADPERGEAPEKVVALWSLDLDAAPLALGTRRGVVKRLAPEYKGWDDWTVIALKDDDTVVAGGAAADGDDLVFITVQAQLLRTPARGVRPQGRAAGGVAGVKLAAEDPADQVLAFAAVAKADQGAALVATLAVGPRPDAPLTAKVTPLDQFPAKGRATGGVRCHRFLKDQDHLALAAVGLPPLRAGDAAGDFRNLPAVDERRDSTGAKVYASFAHLG